jgi:hypothetical protein
MEIQVLQLIAGVVSSVTFASSSLPMVFKAFRTRDLRSYSFGNIGLANLGNLVHWVYVLGLPFGPIWFLHAFSTITTALMLVGYLRYEKGCRLSDLSRCPRTCF